MPSIVSLISVIVLMLFAFLAGVKYCNTVKNQSSWMFETSEEIALPNYRGSYREMRMSDEAISSDDSVDQEEESNKSEDGTKSLNSKAVK